MIGKNIRTISAHSRQVQSIEINREGKFIISGSCDKTIKIWDIQSGKLLKTLLGHNDFILSIAISHDEKLIASGSDDRTIMIWSSSNKENDYQIR